MRKCDTDDMYSVKENATDTRVNMSTMSTSGKCFDTDINFSFLGHVMGRHGLENVVVTGRMEEPPTSCRRKLHAASAYISHCCI